MPSTGHTPVLLEETVRALAVQPGGRYIDCTLGGGGHAEAILRDSFPGGQLLGIDADPKAIDVATARLAPHRDSMLLINDNFVHLQSICIRYDFFPVHGILLDLGLSSMQLNGDGRGFSFQHDAPLDMRLNPGQELTAADIVNEYSEAALADLIHTYGEEGYSRRIARYIVRERPIRTSRHLVRVIERAVVVRKGKIHPATKTFQALRIVVNQEMENLEATLRQALALLGFGGRLVVISYHSLEDRIVKRFLQREARGCICPPGALVCNCGHTPVIKLINRKVITPAAEEVSRNPRSRSARLRAAERITLPQEPAEVLSTVIAGSRGWRRPALIKKLRMVFALA
ncbi:MAG: 16S rRNA (cytosine(1402)-N(4))-methyltransferase RsmH [Chloroflexota bacterium]